MQEVKRNKKAYLDYEHLETWDAGLVLTGAEVKCVKANLINLEGSYIVIKNGEAWLLGASIPRYSKSGHSQAAYVPDRKRKLLLNKQELHYLAGKTEVRGLTIVPLSVYITRRLVKIKIALAKGKRKFDKRKSIKEKEFKRRLNSRVRN